jgi:hypothetical protein
MPMQMLDGLRRCLDVGLSGEQIVAFLQLFAGLHEAMDEFTPEELLERTTYMCQVIQGTIEIKKGRQPDNPE